MVIGYLFCLIAPNVQLDKNAIDIKNEIVVVHEYQYDSTISTTVFYSDFVLACPLAPEIKSEKVFSTIRLHLYFEESNFKLTEKFNFEQFSRPPPTFC